MLLEVWLYVNESNFGEEEHSFIGSGPRIKIRFDFMAFDQFFTVFNDYF